MSELATLTIAEAHQQLRTKTISSEELVQSCIQQIEARNPTLNAVVYLNAEAALERAKEIDTQGIFEHPLSGIPYLAKDVFCEKGVPTTGCSNVLRGEHGGKTYVPPYSSTTTKRLNAVGAISLGKTNTDEFTQGASTETSYFGPTSNPYDPTRVAGGSSGGSAAAVAANMCLFATGTDTGGSIRQPAGFCGCTGLRVTYGRTSRYGVMSMASSLDTIGPIAKNTSDLAHVLQVIAGHDPHDATTLPDSVPNYTSALHGGIEGLTVGLPREYFSEGLDPEVEQSVRTAAEQLKAQGAKLTDVSLPHTKYAVACYYVLCPCEVSSNMARYDGIRFGHSTKKARSLTEYYEQVRSEGFGKEVKRRIMIGTFALSAGYYDAYYRKAQKVRTLIKNDFDEAFKKVDLLLSPVSPTPAFAVGAHRNNPVAMYLEDAYLCAQPLAGIPAISLPCGQSSEGLPIGLQLMAPQRGDELLLRTAYSYEQKLL